MKIREKTFLITVTLIFVLGFVSYISSRVIVLGSFVELEEQDIRGQIERFRSVVVGSLDDMDRLLFDWAAWDDTYDFMEAKDEEYVASNLVDQTFSDSLLDVLLFMGADARMVFGKAFDLEEETVCSAIPSTCFFFA